MKLIKFNSKGIFLLILLTITMSQVYGNDRQEPDCDPCKLEVALNSLSEHYSVLFSYKTNLVKDVEVSFEIRENESFDLALNRLLTGLELKYKSIDSKYYLLYTESSEDARNIRRMERKIKSLRSLERETGIRLFRRNDNNKSVLKKIYKNAQIHFNDITVEGNVVNTENEPLIGVNVLVKGKNVGTTTDFDGKFTLEGIEDGDILVVSYIGYVAQEIVVEEGKVLNIVLEESAETLDEVVVVGYGTQKKTNLTGSVDQVTSDVLENRPLVDVSSGVQGVIPNLNITTRNGEPGAEASFNIRGFTSINGGSPLILVDGIQMNPNMINVSDIKSITVLKDAGAAAIYGARAAFGVVLIETKSGQVGKTTITFRENFSFSKPTITPDVIDNSYDQAVAINEAMFNNNGTLVYSGDRLEGIKAYAEDPVNNPEWDVLNNNFVWYGYNDWNEQLLKDFAPTQNHSLSMSGGSERTQFYTSVGYSKQEGLHKQRPDWYDKFNVNLSVKNQTFSWLTTRAKVGFNNNRTNRMHTYKADETSINSLVFSSPLGLPVKYPGDDPAYQGRYFINPVSYQLLGGRNESRVNHVLINTGLTARVDDYLSFVGDFSYNIYRNNTSSNRKKIHFLGSDFITNFGQTGSDYLELSNSNTNYYAFNMYGQYERTFNDRLYSRGMIGFNQELNNNEWFSSRRLSLINADQPAINLATGDQIVDGNQSQWALRGAFARLNLVYDDKYLFEFNGRYDGSSRFPKASRYGFFPSFSVGWRISREEFLSDVGLLSDFKLRASYGSLGNQTISFNGGQLYYPYIPSMPSGQTKRFLFQGVTDLLVNPPGLISPGLTWETSTTMNFGVDVGLLNDRLGANFDWYKRTTSDMLIRVAFPHVLGADAPAQNGAELQTKGWELSLNWRENLTNEFKLSIRAVLSDNIANITKYENTTGTLGDYYVGQTLGEIWGFETAGIFQSDEEVGQAADQSQLGSDWKAGDIRYKDLNGDGEVTTGDFTVSNPGDYKVIGSNTPRYSFGLGSDMSYHNFFVNIFFQGVGKRDYWPSLGAFWPFASEWFQVQKHFVDNTWSEENRDAYFSRPLARQDKNKETQSRYLQNAAYIRLKNLTLGYNIPQGLIRNIGVQKIQLYLSGQNIWEYSKIGKPLDPEINLGSSGGYLGYPYQRIYSFGLNATF
ncbi:SusC/RagA family TonB-linked outer membrane protein [Membranihabitans maritimus]|uniref:SusC/RagA family TonB-linked outer membrane protein n=1 Tax=Membranihabitans maritimus TaxID=2904244 RepID=UPI001F003642|nr:SusC/RagA family TonB-linked outer membrane protein [Membranihabitans maritimus]